MKRILTSAFVLLVVLSVLSTVNPAAAATLTADRTISGTTSPGSTFTVTIDLYVTGSPVDGLSISDDLSALPSSWTVSPNDGGVYTHPKRLEYVWFDASGNLDDQTVTYDVTIPGDAAIGASCSITGEAMITPPETTIDLGTDIVTVCGIHGDINQDGDITTADAEIALQLTASGEWDANADVDGDGKITSLDALKILQMAAGNT
jgi:hypothetical protein